MLVAFCLDKTMVARKGTTDGTAVTYTEPQPVGDANFVDATLSVAVIFSTELATPGVTTLTALAQGSNNGTDWFDVSAVSIARTSIGLSEDGDYITCVFLRFKLSLGTTASDNNDLAVATFDLHANLTRK